MRGALPSEGEAGALGGSGRRSTRAGPVVVAKGAGGLFTLVSLGTGDPCDDAQTEPTTAAITRPVSPARTEEAPQRSFHATASAQAICAGQSTYTAQSPLRRYRGEKYAPTAGTSIIA